MKVDLKLLRVAMSKLNLIEKKYLMELRFGINTNQKEKHKKKWQICWGYLKAIFQGWRKIIEKMKKDIMKKNRIGTNGDT